MSDEQDILEQLQRQVEEFERMAEQASKSDEEWHPTVEDRLERLEGRQAIIFRSLELSVTALARMYEISAVFTLASKLYLKHDAGLTDAEQETIAPIMERAEDVGDVAAILREYLVPLRQLVELADEFKV